MPTVPLYDRKVLPQAPKVSTPNVGGVVEGAFGEQVAKAQVDLGAAGVKAGTTLLEHMAKQRYYREEEIGDDAGNKLDDFAMKASYANVDEDIEVPGPKGTVTTIKGGWLNTSGYGADKVYQKGTQAIDTYANSVLSTLTSNVSKRKFLDRYNSTKSTYSKSFMIHEAAEMKKGAQGNLMKTVTRKLGHIPNANDAERAIILKDINNDINKGYAKGLLTFEQVKNEKNSVKWNVFLTDFRTDARATEKNFEGGKYGFDIEMAEKARTKFKELNTLRKEGYETTKYTLNTRVMQNDINEEEIDTLVALNKLDPDKGIPEKDGKILKTALYTQIEKDIKAIPQAKKYLKAANMVFSNTADRVKAYDAILEAYDGNQTRDEMLYLNELLKGSKMSKNQNTNNTLVQVWRGLRTAIGFKKPDVEKETEIVRSFINKVRMGDEPQKAAQTTLYEQQVADHPALVGNPEAVSGLYSPSKGTTYLNTKKPKEEKKK